jgi:hypothetical protein
MWVWHTWVRAFVLLACASCGGSVDSDGANEGAAGGQGGSGGAVTGSGGAVTGSGGSSACSRKESHFSAQIVAGIGEQPPGCNTNEWATHTFAATGIVVASDSNKMQIDQCSPAADCVPLLTDVSWSAPQLDLTVPVGAIVQVDYTVSPTWYACSQSLSIVNLASWDGFANPISSEPTTYLVAADGHYGTPTDSPVTITAVALGCQKAEIGGCGTATFPPDDYTLSFTTPEGSTLIAMGSIAAIGLDLVACNLRSYVTGYCDDYWNWGFWVQSSSH